jgi:hypothetical protein
MVLGMDKLDRLIHYVAWKAGQRDCFGATQLYKVLWFADARQFVLTKRAITGAVYIRDKDGPVPKYAMTAVKQLEKAGAIKTTKEGQLTRIVALVAPDISMFSADELKTVDEWIEHIDKEHSAQSMSDESHDYAWEIAAMGEEIPLYAILANRIHNPSEQELGRLQRRAKELGLI